MKPISWFLTGFCLLGGCHPLSFERTPIPDSRTILVLHAIKDIRSASEGMPSFRYIGGITFELFRDGHAAGDYVTTYAGPVELYDLPPGIYTIRIHGRRFESEETMIELKPRERVDLKFSVRTARHNRRIGQSIGTTIRAVGTGALYATVISAVAVAEIAPHAHGSKDSDDVLPCRRCGSRSHRDCKKHK